jgi:hypothetical protein
MDIRTLLAFGLLALTAVAVTPSASAWTGETCVGGYNPHALSNECVKTGDASDPYCLAGNFCPGAKLIVGPRDGTYVEVSANYYGLVCVQGSNICVG